MTMKVLDRVKRTGNAACGVRSRDMGDDVKSINSSKKVQKQNVKKKKKKKSSVLIKLDSLCLTSASLFAGSH